MALAVRQRPVPDRDAARPRDGQKGGYLILEANELWSYVESKRDVRWAWAALDAVTRQVVAMVVGDRSEAAGWKLWDALPAEHRATAVVCSDFWRAYVAVVPEDRHAAAGKDDGLTNHIERFWCTARQR